MTWYRTRTTRTAQAQQAGGGNPPPVVHDDANAVDKTPLRKKVDEMNQAGDERPWYMVPLGEQIERAAHMGNDVHPNSVDAEPSHQGNMLTQEQGNGDVTLKGHSEPHHSGRNEGPFSKTPSSVTTWDNFNNA